MKHKVRLTESDLHRIVRESVKNILEDAAQTSVSKKEERIRAKIGQWAEQIWDIYLKLTNEGDYSVDGKNKWVPSSLYDLVKNEEWVKQLGDAAFDMKQFAEAKKPNYGPYEDDPYHFGY